MKQLVGKVVFLICMLIAYGWINNFDSKGSKDCSTDTDYIICVPKVLKQVFTIMFWVGIALFFIFIFFYIKKIGNVSRGHLHLTIILSLIGLIVLIFANGWKIKVQDNMMTIYKIFFWQRSFYIDDIEKVQIGSKKEIKIYALGKAVTTVDFMCNNYKKLCYTLEDYNVPIENKNK